MKHNAQKIEAFPLKNLKPYPNNSKAHPPKQVAAIAESIKNFGFQQPIVCDEHGEIVLGHGRYLAAEKLGLEAVPVWKVSDFTPEEKVAFRIADNKIALDTELDLNLIGTELLKLKDSNIPIKELSLEFLPPKPSKFESRVKDLEDYFDPEKEKADFPLEVERGDIFTINNHRIINGDSTKRETYEKLFEKERADLVFTDPPYGVAYESASAKNAILGDLSQVAIPLSFKHLVETATNADARFYVCGGSNNVLMYYALFDEYLRMIPRLIIWKKDHFVMRPYNYHSHYEFVFLGWKGNGGGDKFWYGDRSMSDVWEIKRDNSKDYIHPTQKPVELPARAIVNHSPPGAIVAEPFLGSGSTLIACENLGRRCFGVELDPVFIRRLCKRFIQYVQARGGKVDLRRNGEAVDLSSLK